MLLTIRIILFVDTISLSIIFPSFFATTLTKMVHTHTLCVDCSGPGMTGDSALIEVPFPSGQTPGLMVVLNTNRTQTFDPDAFANLGEQSQAEPVDAKREKIISILLSCIIATEPDSTIVVVGLL
jgi:hypothetical protein